MFPNPQFERLGFRLSQTPVAYGMRDGNSGRVLPSVPDH